jgi:hypothetical protein
MLSNSGRLRLGATAPSRRLPPVRMVMEHIRNEQLHSHDHDPRTSDRAIPSAARAIASNCNPANRREPYSLSAFSADTAVTFLRGLRSLSGLGFLVLWRRLARARTNCGSRTKHQHSAMKNDSRPTGLRSGREVAALEAAPAILRGPADFLMTWRDRPALTWYGVASSLRVVNATPPLRVDWTSTVYVETSDLPTSKCSERDLGVGQAGELERVPAGDVTNLAGEDLAAHVLALDLQ